MLAKKENLLEKAVKIFSANHITFIALPHYYLHGSLSQFPQFKDISHILFFQV